MLPFQFIVKRDTWVDSLYMFNGSIDAIRFVSLLLNEFDLQICRKAIYKQRYFQRWVNILQLQDQGPKVFSLERLWKDLGHAKLLHVSNLCFIY